MKIAILIDAPERKGTSINLLGDYAKERFEYHGAEVKLCSKISELEKADVVLNTRPQDILDISKTKRFLHYGKMINWYGPNVEGYVDMEKVQHLFSTTRYPMVLHSPYHYWNYLKWAKKFFNVGIVREIEKNMHYIPYGIDPTFEWGEENDRRLFVCPFNRVNNTQKRINDHMKVSEGVSTHLMAQGHKVEHILVLNPSGVKKLPKGHPYRLVKQPESREQYKKVCQKYGIFISTSEYESFGIYFLELMCSGCVGVYLDKPWVRKLLPGYPYVGDKSDLKKIVVHVFNHYDEAREVTREYREKILDWYDLNHFHDTLYELIQESK